MQPNPVLKDLGFAPADRVALIHVDDVGISHASVAAYRALLEGGVSVAASTMVPCPWFPAVAALCQEWRDTVDMGVHLTLTSRESGCRWRPLSTCDRAAGLVDAAGYFHSELSAVRDADMGAAQREIAAQLDRALAAGIDVTHVDSHRFVIGQHPALFKSYVAEALRRRIPPLLVRGAEVYLRQLGRGKVNEATLAAFTQQLQALEAQGAPTFDHLQIATPEQGEEDPVARLQAILRGLPAGLTYLILHPAHDTPEQRAVRPDWAGRWADYQALTTATLPHILQECGIQVIGWHPLRAWMQAKMGEVR